AQSRRDQEPARRRHPCDGELRRPRVLPGLHQREPARAGAGRAAASRRARPARTERVHDRVAAGGRPTHVPGLARRVRRRRRTRRLAREGTWSMSWRRGELWLDMDLSWSAEPVPALAGYGAPPLPSFGPPPGLIASRLRRAAWKRRREARRAKA